MKLVSPAVSRSLGRQGLRLQKNSPALLFGAGVVGMVGSTVMACRATLKLEEIMAEGEGNLKIAKTLAHPEYSEKDRDRDVTLIYVQTAAKVIRLYGPSIVLGAASIACLAQSQNILNKRNAALGAAYAAMERGFAEYRQRVVDRYGVEEDRNFRYGSKEVKVIDEETGKAVMRTRVGDDTPSIYARFFDPLCPNWSKEPEYNLIFLRCQQNYANDMLRARGHLFLNEVYEMLGIPHSKAGAVVGWVLTDGWSDNYVDFGVFTNVGSEYTTHDFVNGRESSILLDFNVDGVIWDKIDEPSETIKWQS